MSSVNLTPRQIESLKAQAPAIQVFIAKPGPDTAASIDWIAIFGPIVASLIEKAAPMVAEWITTALKNLLAKWVTPSIDPTPPPNGL